MRSYMILAYDCPLDLVRAAIGAMSKSQLDCELFYADDRQRFQELLKQVRFDCVLLSDQIKDMPLMDALIVCGNSQVDTSVIVLHQNPLTEEELRNWIGAGVSDTVELQKIERLPLALTRVLLEQREKTALQQARKEVKDTDERYRSLLNAIPDVVYRLDRDGNFTYINDSIIRLGYQPSELIGKHFSVILHPEDSEQVSRTSVLPNFAGKNTGPEAAPKLFDERRAGERLTRNLQVRLMKHDVTQNDGESETALAQVFASGEYETVDINYYTWAEVTAGGQYEQGVFRTDKNFIGTVGIIRDISDSRQMEEKLRQFSRAIEQSPTSVIITDTQGNIEYVNPKFTTLTGYTLDEVMGKNPRILKSGDMPLESYEQLWKIIRGGGVWEGEFHNKKKNGELYWESASISPIRNHDGVMTHFIAVKEDITTRKEAEKRLRETMGRLEELNLALEKRVKAEVAKNREKDVMMIKQGRLAAMGKMINAIAHQWRQPLNNLGILIQNLQVARDFGKLDDAQIDRTVERSLQLILYLSQTIDDFRNFFKPNRDPIVFDLRDQLMHATNLLEAGFQSMGIAICEEYAEGIRTEGFPNEFSQVVLNLMNNAKEALVEQKTENPRIHLKLWKEGDRAFFEIEDNAGGVPEEVSEHLFEPYYTTKENGTGIGLYMSKMIIENMHGTMNFENREIKDKPVRQAGAVFTICLPAK